MPRDTKTGVHRLLKIAGIFLAAVVLLAAVFFIGYGAHLTVPEINGYQGLYYEAKLRLTGKSILRYSQDPPRFFCVEGERFDEESQALGIEWKKREGARSTALLDGRLYEVWHLSFTSRCSLAVFEEIPSEEVENMVFRDVEKLCLGRYGCEGPIEMASTFDELNILPHEREDMALTLEEIYGVAIPDEALAAFESIEDIVGYIEDRI